MFGPLEKRVIYSPTPNPRKSIYCYSFEPIGADGFFCSI